MAQLHGDMARESLLQLPPDLQAIYVLHVASDGTICTSLPAIGGDLKRPVDWVLLDSLKGGSGEAFDWSRLHVPSGVSKNGWLLAGGLNPINVTGVSQGEKCCECPVICRRNGSVEPPCIDMQMR